MAEDFTLGAEEEYQLVDAASGALRSRAPEVLAGDWAAEIQSEVQETMLEVGTRVCGSLAELDAELRRLRFHVASVAAAQELRVVAAGCHPFSRWEGHRRSQGERYELLQERYGRILRTEHLFGMHVHVAVPSGTDRMVLSNRVRPFIALLLALSASSPRYEGEDTDFASYRAVLWRRMPLTGPPPRFDSEAEYWDYARLLCETARVADVGSLYWSLRPHARYGTLEFRAADSCPRLEDAVAIAALARALVVAAAEGGLEEPTSRLSESALHELLASNEWQAARYGLDAPFVWPEQEPVVEPIRSALPRLLERLRPVAESLGETEVLTGLLNILARGNGAERIRERAARGEPPAELMRWLADESLLGTGLDRRGDQRVSVG